ncbi:hypothetical protein Ahy_B09g097655 [Arachis hypogaea]|uniref:Uncharacterized protein n=1 Tax=Arachis hypogaea TaxID=3818 RepID=A0A444XPS7_ARAHY|nr:hypothetical protein Ahy_B09g097655 [Arachis hypogaea]
MNGPYKDDSALTSFLLVERAILLGELKYALLEFFLTRKPAVVNVIVDPYVGSESERLQYN